MHPHHNPFQHAQNKKNRSDRFWRKKLFVNLIFIPWFSGGALLWRCTHATIMYQSIQNFGTGRSISYRICVPIFKKIVLRKNLAIFGVLRVAWHTTRSYPLKFMAPDLTTHLFFRGDIGSPHPPHQKGSDSRNQIENCQQCVVLCTTLTVGRDEMNVPVNNFKIRREQSREGSAS